MAFLSIAMGHRLRYWNDVMETDQPMWRFFFFFFFFFIVMVTDLSIGINDVMETDQLMWRFFPLLWSPT